MNKQVEVSNLIKPVLDVIKFGKDEISNAFKEGLFNYLHSQTEKFYYTNNFLHRTKKLKFSKIYYPIKATYEKLTTDFSDLKGVFEEYKFIQIIGQAGSGKSTLVNYIFLNSFKSLKKIPILIELRNLNSYEKSLENYILEKILTLKIKPSKSILKRELTSGNFFILLDGYDEITSNRKNNIDVEINDFFDRYSKNYALLTTRPGNGNEFRNRFYSFNVQSLTKEEIPNFIDMQVFDEQRKIELIKVINKASNSDYKDYLSNPLLLSMFILAFESHPEIPKRKSSFYRNVFDTLYSKHDGITKSGFPREKKSRLQREDFENILSIFSYISLIDSKYNFTEEYITDTLIKVRTKYVKFESSIEDIIFDLRTSISILSKDGFEYKFPHRSLQEYFTALFISRLTFDKKPKAYIKLKNLMKASKDRSSNLLNLCFELDEMSFEKYFYLPCLEDALKIFEGKNNNEIINNFMLNMNPYTFLANSSVASDLTIGKRKKVLILYSTQSSFEYYMVSIFKNIIDEKRIMLFFGFNKYALQRKAISILRDPKDYRKGGINWDVGVYDWVHDNDLLNNLLNEYGFVDLLNAGREKLLTKIGSVQKKLNQYNASMDDLF